MATNNTTMLVGGPRSAIGWGVSRLSRVFRKTLLANARQRVWSTAASVRAPVLPYAGQHAPHPGWGPAPVSPQRYRQNSDRTSDGFGCMSVPDQTSKHIWRDLL